MLAISEANSRALNSAWLVSCPLASHSLHQWPFPALSVINQTNMSPVMYLPIADTASPGLHLGESFNLIIFQPTVTQKQAIKTVPKGRELGKEAGESKQRGGGECERVKEPLEGAPTMGHCIQGRPVNWCPLCRHSLKCHLPWWSHFTRRCLNSVE